jgi:hypothetical protein
MVNRDHFPAGLGLAQRRRGEEVDTTGGCLAVAVAAGPQAIALAQSPPAQIGCLVDVGCIARRAEAEYVDLGRRRLGIERRDDQNNQDVMSKRAH